MLSLKVLVIAIVATIIGHPPLAQPADTTPAILSSMEGNWSVSQRTWAGPDAEPTELPPAVATRRVVSGGGYLEEVMTPADPAAGDPFTRTAHLNRNLMSGRFEYFSLDSRAPQQMIYQSLQAGADEPGPIALQGGLFVAAAWPLGGGDNDVPFAYRVDVGQIEEDRQVIRLFLTPQTGGDQREFLAFEYLYTRWP